MIEPGIDKHWQPQHGDIFCGDPSRMPEMMKKNVLTDWTVDCEMGKYATEEDD